MKTCLITCCALIVLAAVPAAAGEPPVEHAKAIERTGILGTRAYTPLEREKPFYERLAEDERVAGSPFAEYSITGKVGRYVGWFGIVREIVEQPSEDRTELLVEMKYFDGLTDLHLQLVSFSGAGDFRANVPGTGLGVKNLSLVRVYGTVTGEKQEGEHLVPCLNAEFVVHWDWGLFSFMNYGTPKGNQAWRRLCKVDVTKIYSSEPDQAYYEARLGSRRAGRETEELEAVARMAFEALKANDLEILRPLIPTADDVRWVAEFMTGRGAPNAAAQLEKQGGPEGVAAKSSNKAEESFAETRAESAAELDWSEAVFQGVLREKTEIREEMGIRSGDVWFVVLAGEKRYRVRLKSCGRIGRGWIVTDGLRYGGAEE